MNVVKELEELVEGLRAYTYTANEQTRAGRKDAKKALKKLYLHENLIQFANHTSLENISGWVNEELLAHRNSNDKDYLRGFTQRLLGASKLNPHVTQSAIAKQAYQIQHAHNTLPRTAQENQILVDKHRLEATRKLTRDYQIPGQEDDETRL